MSSITQNVFKQYRISCSKYRLPLLISVHNQKGICTIHLITAVLFLTTLYYIIRINLVAENVVLASQRATLS